MAEAKQQPGGEAAAAAAAAPAATAAAAAPPAAAAAAPLPAGERVAYHDSLRPPRYAGGPALRVLSWNVASLRALLKKDPTALARLAADESLDVLCLQEHKLQESHVDEHGAARVGLPGWWCRYACSTAKKGYSGTVIYAKQKPLSCKLGIGAEEHDQVRRVS